MRFLIAWIIVAAFTAEWACAQPPEAAGVRGDSSATRKRLADAEQMLIAGKTVEAREAIVKAMDEAGDDLILIEGGRYVSARWFAQRLLAKLTAEQLNPVRERIDGAAKKLLDDGASRRDPRPLLELLDRYFVSRPTENALKLLGELAFERGEFALAENYWARLIAPVASEEYYPGPIRDAATVESRIILAVQRQGEIERAAVLFKDFQKSHAEVKGRLAGRDGSLAAILREEVTRPPAKLLEVATDRDWPMLGANPARTGFVPGNLTRLPPSPLWTMPIPGRDMDTGSVISSVRSVAFHPVMDGRNIYLADGGNIYQFDFETGKHRAIFTQRTLHKAEARSWRDADFALTVAGGRLYARLGEVAVIPSDSEPNALLSHLVCLSPPQRDGDSTVLHWSRRPPVAEGILAGWEGAPLVVDGRVLAAFSRGEGGRIVQAIACYDDRGEKPLWVTDVCELGVGAAENRERHELLTLAGANVIFASHSGVIAAVNRHSGKPAWSYRYPRIVRPPLDGRYRDISPAVASEGRVFVAPNDSDHLFAFDALSGRVLWQDGPILVDHLIGVAGPKVIAAIAGPNRGLRAYHTASGSRDAPFGWIQQDDPNLATFGRGLIAGEHVAWPTAAGLYLIRLQDGLPARPPLRGVHGNLAFADGKLLVASTKSLSLFAAPTKAEPPSLAMPLTMRPASEEKPMLIDAARSLSTITSETILPPMLSANPKIAIHDIVKRGERFFQPANDGAWAQREGEPTLRSSSHGGDAIIYRGGDAIIADGSVLSRRTAGSESAIWLRDLSLPIRTLHDSPSGILIARLGEHHFAAIDGATGKFLWALDSSRRTMLAPFSIASSACFDEHFSLDNQNLILHLSSDRCWQISTARGEILKEWPCRSGPWTAPPVKLEDGVIAYPSGPGSVAGYDPAARQNAWVYERGSAASLAGIAPQLRSHGDSLDVLIHKNHGCELIRLNQQGRAIWKSGPAFLDAATINLADMAADRGRIYLALPDRVIALHAETGCQFWQAPLPDASRWSLHALGNAVAAVPRTIALPSLERVPVALLRHGTLPVLSAITEPEPLPILILDPETGAVKHRLEGGHGPILAVTVRESGLWLASPRAIYLVK